MAILNDILTTYYYGNMLSTWLVAIIIIIVAFVAGRVIHWFVNQWLLPFARKRNPDTNNIIIDLLEEPLTVNIALYGVYYGVSYLNLPAQLADLPEKAYQFLLPLVMSWYLIRLYDLFHFRYLIPITIKSEAQRQQKILPIIRNAVRFFSWALATIIGLLNANYDIWAVFVGLVVAFITMLVQVPNTIKHIRADAETFLKGDSNVKSDVETDIPQTKQQRIFIRVAIGLAVISLLLVVVFVSNYYNDQRYRKQLAYFSAQAKAKSAAESINNELNTLVEIADNLANDLTTKQLEHTLLTSRLREYLDETPNFYGIGVAYTPDLPGQLYAPYYKRDEHGGFRRLQVEDNYDYMDANNSAANWFFTGLQSESGEWTEIYYDETAQTWLIEYVVPFFQDNQPIGVVDIGHSLDTLAKLVSFLDFGQEGYAFILSRTGKVLVHPDEDFVGKNIFEVAEELDNEDLETIGNRATQGQSFSATSISVVTKQDSWVFCEPISLASWSICIMFDQAVLISAPNTTKQNFTHVMLATMAFLFFMSIIIFQAEQTTNFSLWAVSMITAFLFFAGIGFIWSLEIIYPPRDSSQTILVNQTQLNEQIDKINQDFINDKLPKPVHIPTGIMLETIGFGGANENTVTGYIWQKYPLDLSEDIERAFIFTDAVDEGGSTIEEMYRFVDGNVEVIAWAFRAVLRQEPSVGKYPLDQATVQVQLWPKSIDKNLLLVPDLEDYQLTIPTQHPGLVDVLVLEDWYIQESYFSYRFDRYNAHFGSSRFIKKGYIPDLYYNVIISRYILSPIIAHAITIFVVAALVFAVLVVYAETSFNVLSYAAALFFVVAVSHVGLRSELQASGVVYLEYFYIVLYVVFLLASVNAIVFYSETNIEFIQYRNNLIPKLLYWPILLGMGLLITLVIFYPETDLSESLDHLEAAETAQVEARVAVD